MDNPYRIGTNILKFKFQRKDSIIAFIIGSFIFEQLVLYDLYNDKESLNTQSEQYRNNLIAELTSIKNSDFDKKQHYQLTAAVKKFYDFYRPELNQKYYISFIKMFNISLDKLNSDS